MIAVIGAGVSGLTAAIRLAQQGRRVWLFEAAPEPGGRTTSFHDSIAGCDCDNGPHLIIGAYQATRRLLQACNAEHHLSWQSGLELPLWERARGHFSLKPSTTLPLALALPIAVARMPGHDIRSSLGMLRMHLKPCRKEESTADWFERLKLPEPLIADLLLPLCLGSMNEYPQSAPAASFSRVIREAFASHDAARLGWFNRPLQTGLIEPLARYARTLGVRLFSGCRVRGIGNTHGKARLELASRSCVRLPDFDHVILTIPPWAAARIRGLSRANAIQSFRPITNLHLWYEQPIHLPAALPLIGGIGTLGQWFFNVSQQHADGMALKKRKWSHIAAVISADRLDKRDKSWVRQVIGELADITGQPAAAKPVHMRIVQEARATSLVRQRPEPEAPDWLIHAGEAPAPGDLPATIEAAVIRGEKAAQRCLMSHK